MGVPMARTPVSWSLDKLSIIRVMLEHLDCLASSNNLQVHTFLDSKGRLSCTAKFQKVRRHQCQVWDTAEQA